MSKVRKDMEVVFDPASFDSTPVEMPFARSRALSERDEMLRLIREELSRTADEHGEESFEEADDFDVSDDELPYSPHELTPMQEEFIMHPERFARVQEKKDESVGADRSSGVEGKSPVGNKESGAEVDKSGDKQAGAGVSVGAKVSS